MKIVQQESVTELKDGPFICREGNKIEKTKWRNGMLCVNVIIKSYQCAMARVNWNAALLPLF